MPLLLPEGHRLLQKQVLAGQRLLPGPRTRWPRHQIQRLRLCPCCWETLAPLQEAGGAAVRPSAAGAEFCPRWGCAA